MAARFTLFSQTLYFLGFSIRLLGGAYSYVFRRRRISFRLLILQILFTFVEALGITSLLALGLGAGVCAVGLPFLSRLSQERLIYTLLITMITRELGPLFTAIIISARSATAMATEVAGMVISHEVEAYISIGIDPIEYLGVPRFLGGTLSMLMLNSYFSFFGLGASFLVTQAFTPLPAGVYFHNLVQALSLPDILISLGKSLFCGMAVSTIALFEGFAVEHASTEVPVAGLRAVGASLIWCVAINLVFSILYYGAMG
ncbi:MAG: ABC transporter permease [Treponema sp.]|jgi:phospholipid/cholesterol/gamma-HCH transport system permease protein|nr:ABC transporter permease [Treponema sp.]